MQVLYAKGKPLSTDILYIGQSFEFILKKRRNNEHEKKQNLKVILTYFFLQFMEIFAQM